MQEQQNVIACYNKTAQEYAKKFLQELDNKHLDRILLKSFIAENAAKGKLIDLGCGPGQTTNFLFANGISDIIGIDISTEMVKVAKENHPALNFEQGDMLNLKYADSSFGSAISFYSIVHFDYSEVRKALIEIKRILCNNGELLFTFHVGEKIVHFDKFLGHEVEIDFYFFEITKIKDMLIEIGLEVIDVILRLPYHDIEHKSERAYVWARKINI